MNANLKISDDKIVSADSIRKLTSGSYEHLGFLIDESIQAKKSSFVRGGATVSRMATFEDHIIVGTSDGDYFNVKFEDKNGEIILDTPVHLDVPVVSASNAVKSLKDFSLDAVDSLMSEGMDAVIGKLLILADLQGQKQISEARDYPGEAMASVVSGRPWREAFASQANEITRQVVDKLESIRGNALESKYKPMYESDEIPEEKFENYRSMALADLEVLSNRLQAVHESAETAYLPFRDSLSEDEMDEADEEVLSHFCFFSEDLIADLGEVRAIVADTVANEQCVMCLGQVYDTIVESLTDYEIAGSFVQRMTGALDDSV